MIDRYVRPQMDAIWCKQNKYNNWKEIEVLCCEAQAELGVIGITREEAAIIREKANFDLERVDEIEAQVHHDVIAFLTNLGEFIDAGLPAEASRPSRWVHFGMTSTDLVDTAQCYQLKQATDILIEDVQHIQDICVRRAFEFKDTLCVGRTHGIHAEPMTFGMKFAGWAWAMHRSLLRLKAAQQEIATGALSGAIGTYSSIDPFVEQYVCEKLGLTPDPLSTQVIARDRHAQVLSTLAVVASTCEQIAIEVRALQRSEVLEAEEPFARGQKGSSAMPHKRNPITAERICGLARVVKANAQVGYDDVALWHERDISHSSSERVVLPDSFCALDYLLGKLEWILDGLVVYPENMLANLNRTRGLIYSSKALLALIENGCCATREEAYAIVQENAMRVWQDIQQAQSGPTFRELLENDERVVLDSQVFDEVFNPQAFLDASDVIFKRLEALQ